jgi:hypothetical protein
MDLLGAAITESKGLWLQKIQQHIIPVKHFKERTKVLPVPLFLREVPANSFV